MKNIGLQKFKTSDVDNFTSNFGMEHRKHINPLLRKMLKIYMKEELIIDHYPKLNDDEPYIFVSTHGFVEDAVANLATLDRNSYVLFGTTNQLEDNPETYMAWYNGFIYIDRDDENSRKQSIKKMERVIKNGNSVLLYAEGGLNNTENLLLMKLFLGPYVLAQSTKAKIVPVAPFYEFGSDKIYMNVGNPIRLDNIEDKKEAMTYLRDTLATLVWENIENHATHLRRSELGKDPRRDFMEERRKEYMKKNWTRDVWDEELKRYFDEEDREYISVQESMDKIKITEKNAKIMAPILVRREEDKKYDFKEYMHEHWDKDKKEKKR